MAENDKDPKQRIIVIGASTGGFEALNLILVGLKDALSATLIVCQHIDKSARLNYSMIFRELSGFHLHEVEDKQRIMPGNIYFAPPGYHLYVESDGYFGLSLDALVNWSRPSIDVLFESAARAYDRNVVGLLLTGANSDGVQGIREIKRLGGVTIAQDPLTALAPTMPKMAIETGCVDHIAKIQDVAALLVRLINREQISCIGAL
ncbi:MAG: chemotaxis protein CheB [Oligoflexus sp.]|nr:chemotaxis protein CheB [Oligoflexus sp.]